MSPGRRRPDDGVALVIVLAFGFVAATLLLVLISLLRSELAPAAFQGRAASSLRAAHSGVDVATAAIRSAVSARQVGDLTALPCADQDSPITGVSTGDDRRATYTVVLRYYTADPAAQDESWRAAHALPCTPGSGPTEVPVYALISSVGAAPEVGGATGSLGVRSIEDVYRLRFTDAAEFGGWIQAVAGPNLKDYCWTAAVVPPVLGAAPVFAPCAPGQLSQLWSYRSDFSIALTATESAPGQGGTCLDAAWSGGNPTLSFQPCDGSARQKWGQQPFGGFEALTEDGAALSGFCIHPVSGLSSGEQMVMGLCSGQARVTTRAETGSGGASTERGQLVNFEEFGFCADTDSPQALTYTITYPCDQNPTQAVADDQRFTYDAASGWLWVSDAKGAQVCLTAPSALGGYVTQQNCSASDPLQSWTRNADTGYRTTSYTIVSRVDGSCIGLGPGGKNGPVERWSGLITQACDGSMAQKWGAVPMRVGGALSDYQDLGAG